MGRNDSRRPHKYRSNLKANMGMAYMPAGSVAGKFTKMCDYGRGCTRKDCVYQHPSGPAEEVKSGPVCLPFVAGACAYGRGCYNRHPAAEELSRLKIKYASIPCRHGAECFSEACPYAHPHALNGNGKTCPVASVGPSSTTESDPKMGGDVQDSFEEFLKEMQTKKTAQLQSLEPTEPASPEDDDFEDSYQEFLQDLEREQVLMEQLEQEQLEMQMTQDMMRTTSLGDPVHDQPHTGYPTSLSDPVHDQPQTGYPGYIRSQHLGAPPPGTAAALPHRTGRLQRGIDGAQ